MNFFNNKSLIQLVAIILSIYLGGCSAQKFYDEGNYERAIEKAIKQLDRNPAKVESIDLINLAFNKANENDLNEIDNLLNSKNEINWTAVYYKYKGIVKRQKKIGVIDNLNYSVELTNYQLLMEEAQTKAAENYYQAAVAQLDNVDSKKDFQKVHFMFASVNRIYPGYKDVYNKLSEIKKKGIYHVLVVVENPNKLALTEQAMETLLNANFTRLNSEWVIYHERYQQGMYYDYTAVYEVTHFIIDNNQESKKNYTDSKDIVSKYIDRKDAKGNLVKNEKGEVIKDPVMKTIKATIRKTEREKESAITGTLKLIDNFEMNTFKEVPITRKYTFSNQSAVFVEGNKAALTSESLALMKQKLKPFPTYQQMLLQNANLVSSVIKQELKKNQSNFGIK